MADITAAMPMSRDRTLNAANHVFYVNLSDEANELVINSDGSLNVTQSPTSRVKIWDGVDEAQVSDDGELCIKISAGGADNSEANPVFVQVSESGVSANEVHDYSTAVAVASAATDTHTYTATGGVFLWKKAIVSASGAIKAEFQNNAVTFAVGFSSIANPNIDMTWAVPVEITDTETADIIRTNREDGAMDLYSTIIGNQL